MTTNMKLNLTQYTMTRKLNLCLRCVAIFAAFYGASASHANTMDGDSNLPSSRSSIVDYKGESPSQITSRNAKDTHEAQRHAIEAVKELAHSAEPRKTRQQVITERKYKLQNKTNAMGTVSTLNNAYNNYVEFDIYNASSRLFEDFDYDGFYQTFSVTFDADVYGQYSGERALVYADLYLSRDGGPWELYFTTDTFVIIDDISDDEFEVLTTLDLGYKTAHYDVLVDLYEVGYSDVVATISSDDVESLYALPLESADRDEYVVIETYPPDVIISAGSVSISGLVILLSVLGWRKINHLC